MAVQKRGVRSPSSAKRESLRAHRTQAYHRQPRASAGLVQCEAVAAAQSLSPTAGCSFSATPRTSPMNIFANTAVTISFQAVRCEQQIDRGIAEPLVYLHGGTRIFPKIERR
jgi:hypothetical protein